MGTLVAGGGAALGTGAFSSVEAERTVSVETASDANAFLALTPASGAGDYVTTSDGMIEIDIGTDGAGTEGVNQNGLTTFDELIDITNQGTNNVNSITFTIQGDNGEDALLTPTPGSFGSGDFPNETTDDTTLAPSESVTFGLEIELRESELSPPIDAYSDGDINDANFDPTILIEASTSSN
jgi:hypothetical protein